MKTNEKLAKLTAWDAFQDFLNNIYDEDYIETADPERIEFEWQEFKKDYSFN